MNFDDRIKHYHADGRPYTEAETLAWNQRALDVLHGNVTVQGFVNYTPNPQRENVHGFVPMSRPKPQPGGWPTFVRRYASTAMFNDCPIPMCGLPM